jgi:hypothetical protein
LAQIKASENNKDYDLVEINKLYLNIDPLLNPEKAEINKRKKVLLEEKVGAANSTIRGVVSSGITGAPVSNHFVGLYNSIGDYLGSNYTDSQGRYIFSNLNAGEYITVAIANNDSFVDTVSPNIACAGSIGVGCQIADLSLFNLAEGELLQHVNISI